MVTSEQVARINELARKKKGESLTKEELTEQQNLRQIYIDSIRRNIQTQFGDPKDNHL